MHANCRSTWVTFLGCAGMINYPEAHRMSPNRFSRDFFARASFQSILSEDLCDYISSIFSITVEPRQAISRAYRCARPKQPKLLPEMLIDRSSENRD